MAYVGNLSEANVRDFDGDGVSDVLWWNNEAGGDNTVQFWSFAAGETNPQSHVLGTVNPEEWDFIGTGDLNADGRTDILWQNDASGDVVAWAMGPGGVPVSAQVVGNANGYEAGVLGDFNGDGTADLLWVNGPASLENVVWNFHPTGTTAVAADGIQVVGDINLEVEPDGLGLDNVIRAAGDYDGDGKVEFVIQEGGGLLEENEEFSVGQLNYNPNTGSFSLQISNLNNIPQSDGDIVPFAGDKQSGRVDQNENYDTPPAATPAGDFNADGTQDIWWVSTDDTFASGVQQYFQFVTVMSGGDGVESQVVGGTTFEWNNEGFGPDGSGDYNGDGTTDVVWHNTVNAPFDVAIWNIEATQIESVVYAGAAVDSWNIIA